MRSVALNRHTLPLAFALVVGALSVPSPVRGLTLGNIDTLSSLGQPLRVVIPVALNSGETLHVACVGLVADNIIAEMPQLVTGRVSLEQGTAGTRLVITTAAPVREPALRLAVQTGCGSSTRRDYVLLLDPPDSESPAVVAAADADEAPWTREPRQSTPVAPASPRPDPIVASALPPTTWGAPVAAVPQAAEAQPKARDKIAPEARPEAPVAVAPSDAAHELVAVSNSSGGGFISEAGAASLATPIATPHATSPQSLPLTTQPVWRTQAQPSAARVWQQMSQYAIMILGAIALVLVAFAAHRRRAVQTSWMDPQARTSVDSETQVGPPNLTFAQFGDPTEPNIASPRTATKLPPVPEQSVEVSELDTLLQDIQADMIDERTIKEAWRAAAGDSPLDMGSDSILRAIAAAERDLQIGVPEPKQLVLERALEKDLLKTPDDSMKVRFG